MITPGRLRTWFPQRAKCRNRSHPLHIENSKYRMISFFLGYHIIWYLRYHDHHCCSRRSRWHWSRSSPPAAHCCCCSSCTSCLQENTTTSYLCRHYNYHHHHQRHLYPQYHHINHHHQFLPLLLVPPPVADLPDPPPFGILFLQVVKEKRTAKFATESPYIRILKIIKSTFIINL